MAFWDIFKQQKDSKDNQAKNRLQQKIKNLLPNADESELIKVACIGGLLARIAYMDFEIHKNEISSMKNSLKEWSDLNDETIDAIVKVAIDEIKDLSGLENQKYCHPLNDIMDNNQKYGVLVSLFAIAASDGNADNQESEEIRIISQGLKLEHKHFVSARATVMKKLGALK